VVGPNAVRSHRARALPVLVRQLRSPLLLLLAVTALASTFLGQRSDAVIIGVILLASVSLGQRVPLHAVTLQNAYPFHHPAEAALAALVDPVGVVDPGRAVDRQADQKTVPSEERAPLFIQQGCRWSGSFR
jgi:P-type Mg2+ transporter